MSTLFLPPATLRRSQGFRTVDPQALFQPAKLEVYLAMSNLRRPALASFAGLYNQRREAIIPPRPALVKLPARREG